MSPDGYRALVWQKMLVNLGQELVIAGYTPSLKSFDALVIGCHEGAQLLYAARTRGGFRNSSESRMTFGHVTVG
jgi:hypothetical protein